MSDHLKIKLRSEPWTPSPHAQLTKSYHKYDVPLVGMLNAEGQDYLFACRYRGTESLSVWMYVLMSHGDVSGLDDAAASSVQDFSSILDKLEERGPTSYALAHDDYGVVGCLDSPMGDLRLGIEKMISRAGLPAGVEVEDEQRRLLEVVP